MKATVLITLGVLALLTVSTPSEAKRRDKNVPTPEAQTQAFVDAQMHATIGSIDRSLSTLVGLSRGGEAARQAPPIGWTVAGASSQPRAALTPAPLPEVVVTVDPRILDQQVDIQWNGSAEALLSNFANQLGFSFRKNSKQLNKTVHLNARRVSVRTALNMIANQLEGRADVRVSLVDKQITLQVR